MEKLVLRNDRVDSGTWFFTAAAFALAGLGCVCGLVVANVRDPKALWMGPDVKAPQAVYLFLEGLALVVTLAMAGLAVYKGRKFFDRSVQLVIDGTGVHDARANGRETLWSQVTEVKGWSLYSGSIATAAQLRLMMKNGSTVVVDILGLDLDHKSIANAAGAILEQARSNRGGDVPEPRGRKGRAGGFTG